MRRFSRVLVPIAALTLVLSACASETGDTTTTTAEVITTSVPTTSTTQPPTTTTQPPTTTTTIPAQAGAVVYFLLEELEEDAAGPFLVPVYRDVSSGEDPAQQAVDLLLEGPTDDEMAGLPAISTAIPDGTESLGGSVDDGVATVNLSDEFDDGGGSFSMFARLAQVVYTVTRVEGVDAVEFQIEGEPVTVFSSEGIELDGAQDRTDYYDLLPPIFLDTPAWGEPVTSPIHVSGLSNVFEAVSQVMLTDDDGETLFEETVMASCGTGCWGEWETDITYTIDRDQFGALIVWEFSAEDGSRIHVREYPVQLR
ncbi:MAG TPA: GerMN domain-containing protein [Acidimicrobiia bacterium]